jgi:hypothetical protein
VFVGVGVSLGFSRQVQLDPEHTALPDCAFHANDASHPFGQPLAHHQADACTLLGLRLLSETIERLEKLGELFRSQPLAGVPDADPNRVPVGQRTLHDNLPAHPIVFDRVG